MCTVTYLPAQNGFHLCSNRDEKKSRSAAIKPFLYDSNALKIIYPKDPDGQGSWIAAKNDGTAAVLLNGAFKKHQPGQKYRKSRGLILIEVISSANPSGCFEQIELNHIEPFTLIIGRADQLNEYRWDGEQKYRRALDTLKAHIWSSATLYDQASALKRKTWFDNWRQNNPEAGESSILDFHLNGGDGNSFDGLVINRNEEMKTVSITCLTFTATSIRMSYSDLITGRQHEMETALH